MSLNPRCFALAQISSLVGSLTKKNFKTSCQVISKVKQRGAKKFKRIGIAQCVMPDSALQKPTCISGVTSRRVHLVYLYIG